LAGTYHLTADGSVSWHGYAQYVLELAQKYGFQLRAGPADVQQLASTDYPVLAARPRNSRLDTSKFRATFQLRLPDWQFHVRRLIAELAASGQEAQ
jgi:dTDP-4-dehydrorhamnose reductase